MPTQDRVGGNNRGQFHQRFSAQGLAFDGQQSALVIGQQKPFLPLCLHHGFKFRLIELDDLLLLAWTQLAGIMKQNCQGCRMKFTIGSLGKRKNSTILPRPKSVKGRVRQASRFHL